MHEAKLSRRLYAAFLLVREGKTVADIGTDHGLLPIALVKFGKSKKVLACDVNPLPLEKAHENIESQGLSSYIDTVLTNGAIGLDGKADEFIIAGMGGELISTIIEDSPFLKNENVHLVLQPMTKQKELREYLWNNGFEIEKESYLFEGHYYTVMSVSYIGKKTEYTPLDLEIGKEKNLNTEEKISLVGIIKEKLSDINRKIYGKIVSGRDTSKDLFLKEAFINKLKELGVTDENI